MYAELTIILRKPAVRHEIATVLSRVVAGNEVDVKAAVFGTHLATAAAHAMFAELIGSSAVVVYFTAGTDTVLAVIFAESMPQLRIQCMRISRQLAEQNLRARDVRSNIRVSIEGVDTHISTGVETGYRERFYEVLKEEFIGRFVPPFVACGLAMKFMTNTPAVTSAWIALIAAVTGRSLMRW